MIKYCLLFIMSFYSIYYRTAYAKGQLDVCKKKSEICIDMLGRFTEDEVPTKPILLSTLYSCLGNCAMKVQDYVKALEYHDHDLSIGEET